MNKITILLTGTGAPGAPGIIKCIRNNGERDIRIVGVDMNKSASGRKLVDAFYEIPSAKDPSFLKSVLEICIIEKVQIVIPLVTRELQLFSDNIHIFHENGIEVSVMDSSALKIVNNKANLLRMMTELNMSTPLYYVCNTVNEVETAIFRIGYPQKGVCVKAVEGNGSRGVRIIDPQKSQYDLFFNEKPNSMYMSFHDVMQALKEKDDIPQMMVMEYLPGEEYGVDALADNGKIICIAGRYNYSVNSSIPQGSIIENRQEPISVAIEIINKLHLSGNINFDFKYDKNVIPKLIEINPRLSATIVSYAPAGINFPYLQIKRLLKEKITPPHINEGILMQRRYNEVFFDTAGNEIEW